jgi:hypothetical protein
MKGSEKGKLSPFDLDLRVRDRHLASGLLDAKVLERHLADLPDLDAQADTLPFEQPALGSDGEE